MSHQSITKVILLGVCAIFTSCGKIQEDGNQGSVTETRKGRPDSENCPLYFADSHLCADWRWISGPTAAQNSSIQIRFWEADKTSAQLISPSLLNWRAFFYMRCGCESTVLGKSVRMNDSGSIEVGDIRLWSGEWDFVLQVAKRRSSVSENLEMVRTVFTVQ